MADSHCTSKFCNGCQTAKPVSEWPRNKGTRDRLAHRCKACTAIASRAWREANPERHRANAKRIAQEYKQANANGPRVTSRICARCYLDLPASSFALKPDMCSGLSTYCKECTREIDRDRSKTEARIASHKAYAERNKERINERQRDFYTRNKELFYTHNRKRKARLVSVGGAHTRDDIARLLKLQKHRCAYCRCSIRKSRHIDHIVPLKLGGSNDWTNLQALCPPCNLKKGAKDPTQYANKLGLLL